MTTNNPTFTPEQILERAKAKLHYAGQAASMYPDEKEEIWAVCEAGMKELDDDYATLLNDSQL